MISNTYQTSKEGGWEFQMLLRQLEYFCAVARLGSFRQAAEVCFVSQSAISQQVRALEQELGEALTERRGRSFVLTPAGEAVARRGQHILDEVMRMRFEVHERAHAPQTLSVGYLNRYAGWEVSAALAAFAQRHPDVRITARSGDHEALYEGIREGSFDILMSDRRRQLSDEFVNKPLFTGYAYIEVSEASSLAWREHVTVPELAHEECILVAAPAQRDAERSYYRDVLNFPCAFTFAETMEEAHMLAAGNRGVLPLEARENEGRSGTILRRIPLVDAAGEHRRQEYYAFWLKARTNPLVEEFADVLGGLFA